MFNKNFRVLFILSLVLLGSFFVNKKVFAEEVLSIAPPIILDAYQVFENDKVKIFINGLTISLTDCQVSVLIYINNDYYDFANIKKINEFQSLFSYESPWIEKQDEFEIMTINRNGKTLLMSPPSSMKVISVKKPEIMKEENSIPKIKKETVKEIIKPVVEYFMPAPTLLNPKTNLIKEDFPTIFGLTKNDSLITIFLDHKKLASFYIKSNYSETTNFQYVFKKPLERGGHIVYATATNKDGKESKRSNMLNFFKYEPKTTATSTTETIKEDNIEKPYITVEKLIQAPSSSKNNENDNVDKDKNNFKSNLFIFFIFISIIVLWMFLVNKELIKEKDKS